MSKPILLRWLVVCLIPLATLLWFALNPPEDKTQHLINGIILACEATFLFKFVLFDVHQTPPQTRARIETAKHFDVLSRLFC